MSLKIDYEQGKISMRIGESVFYALQADVRDFATFKERQKKDFNENAFFNKLLPNLIEYRMQKRKALRKYLVENFSEFIKDGLQDKVFSLLDDVFDNVYFDDKEEYCSVKIDFRLSKENLIALSEFFGMLKSCGVNKTPYIRNLLNEYVNKKNDFREWLYFNQEYEILHKALDENSVVAFECDGESHQLFPIDLDLEYLTRSIWFIGIEEDCAKAFRLRKMEKISVVGGDVKVSKEQYEKASEYVSKYDYINMPILKLGEE